MVDGSVKMTVIRSNNIKINSETQITKCPVCHKTETWNVEQQYCSTCCDVEQNPTVLRLVKENATAQKKNSALVADDAEAKKLNIKNEMQTMFNREIISSGLAKEYFSSDLYDFTSDNVWDLHQRLMTYFYQRDLDLAKLHSPNKYALIIYSLYIGSMVKGLLYNLYGANSIFPSVIIMCMVILLIIELFKTVYEESEYITKYREFEKLHGKNARFF